jgi:hypothetical protein
MDHAAMSLTRSKALPSSPFIRFLRYWLPALVCVAGVVVAAARGFDDIGLEGGAAIIGAGSSIWLMNILWRVGVSGEQDRDDEDAARRYFDEHGRWPDEDRSAARR